MEQPDNLEKSIGEAPNEREIKIKSVIRKTFETSPIFSYLNEQEIEKLLDYTYTNFFEADESIDPDEFEKALKEMDNGEVA